MNLRDLNLWRVLERGSGVLSRWGFRGLEGIAERRRQRPSGSASVVESSGDAIMSGSLEGIITGWNPGAERLYGYSTDEAVGRPLWEAMNPLGGSDVVARNIDKVKRGEVVGPFDARCITAGKAGRCTFPCSCPRSRTRRAKFSASP